MTVKVIFMDGKFRFLFDMLLIRPVTNPSFVFVSILHALALSAASSVSLSVLWRPCEKIVALNSD